MTARSTPVREVKEYRVIHELGPQYAVPALLPDRHQAEEMVKMQREIAENLGMGHTADGWYIESRTITAWRKDEPPEGLTLKGM